MGAIACSAILVEKIREDFLSLGKGDVCMLCDLGALEIQDIRHCISHGRAVVVLLTHDSLLCKEQLWLIATAMKTAHHDHLTVVPVNCPSFVFPGRDFFASASFAAICD